MFFLAAVLSTLPASAAVPAASAESDEEDGFRVESRRLEDYRGTQVEVESNIIDDLATKLRQFDEWTVDGEAKTADAAAEQAAADAAAEQAAADAAAQQAAADAAAEQAAADAAAAAASGALVGGGRAAGPPITATDPSSAGSQIPTVRPFDPNAATIPTGVRGGLTSRRGAQQQQIPPLVRPDRRAKEDDVALMIREAAEQETDPGRRQELMDQYEAYVDSL